MKHFMYNKQASDMQNMQCKSRANIDPHKYTTCETHIVELSSLIDISYTCENLVRVFLYTIEFVIKSIIVYREIDEYLGHILSH